MNYYYDIFYIVIFFLEYDSSYVFLFWIIMNSEYPFSKIIFWIIRFDLNSLILYQYKILSLTFILDV